MAADAHCGGNLKFRKQFEVRFLRVLDYIGKIVEENDVGIVGYWIK